MFFQRRFIVWLVAVCLSEAAHTKAKSEDSDTRILTQANAEAVMRAQTILRHHLITVLENISQALFKFEYQSIVNDIIKGLQTRTLDPVTSFIKVNSNQSVSSQMASIIYNLQGGALEKKTLPEWNSILEKVGHIPPLPDIHLNIPLLERFGFPIVNIILMELKKNLKANSYLVKDILYNYHFRNPTPDVYVIVSTINRKLRVDFRDFQPRSNSRQPAEIFSDILQHIQHQTGLSYELDLLRSSLSNVDRVKAPHKLSQIFDMMLSEDYPPDVIKAKNNITAAIDGHQIPFNRTAVFEMLRGYTPTEKLLGLIAELVSTPSPYSQTARGIYPHVKLRYLFNQEKFFRARTASDVAFLLDSFLTVPNQINPTLVKEIPKFFLLPDVWSVFDDFDFSQYSKPRPLVLNMLQQLLDSNKFPICYVVMITLFLKTNGWEKPLNANYSDSTVLCETYTFIIDPHSLINITTSDPNQKYLADLITARPIYYEEHKNLARRQIVQAIIQRELATNFSFTTSSKGEWPPVVRPVCLTSHCPKERRAKIINPSDIIAIIAQPSQPIVEMIMKQPIFYHQYGKYRTQGEVYKALVETRGGNLHPKIIENTVMNTRANSPPSFFQICLKKPITCRPVIDVQSLLEIIENNTQMAELFPKGSFPARKYEFLGNRVNILRHILRQHYSSSTGSVLNPKLMKASNELIFNKKGSLPPVVKISCVAQETVPINEKHIFVYDIESALKALNSSEGVELIRNKTRNFFIPCDRKKNYSKAEVLELILDTWASGTDSKINQLKNHILYSGLGQKPAEVKLTCIPKNILEDEEILENKCATNEKILSIVDTDKVFTVLKPHAVEASYLKSRIKSIIIPIGNPKKYTKGEVLREVLDKINEEISNVRVKRIIGLLKKNIGIEGAHLPDVAQVCLPNYVIEEIQNENSPLPQTDLSLQPITDLLLSTSETYIFSSSTLKSNLSFLVSSTPQPPQPPHFRPHFSTSAEPIFSTTLTPRPLTSPVIFNSSLQLDFTKDPIISTKSTSAPLHSSSLLSTPQTPRATKNSTSTTPSTLHLAANLVNTTFSTTPESSKNSTTSSLVSQEYQDLLESQGIEESFYTEDYIITEDTQAPF